ncbi:hypothetical protein WKW77_34130 [Variovorax ureilyticus]|uniref:Uncharacterized protein n=1 Tax=Variovorax ureilyticus TaxID=1836198 RepID=A0ABU8VR31_9BURK
MPLAKAAWFRGPAQCIPYGTLSGHLIGIGSTGIAERGDNSAFGKGFVVLGRSAVRRPRHVELDGSGAGWRFASVSGRGPGPGP